MKKSWRYHHFNHGYHKWKSYVYDSCDMEHDREFFLILGHLLLFYTPLALTTQRIKILKKWKKKKKKKKKNAWRYQHLTQVYHKWQSYHIWFLRYGVHQTEFFCYLGPFFPLLPPWQAEKWKFQKKKWKKIAWEISSFYTSVPKIIIICYTLHEICHVTNVIVIFHFGQFFWSFTTPSPAPHLQQPQKRKAQQKWKNP